MIKPVPSLAGLMWGKQAAHQLDLQRSPQCFYGLGKSWPCHSLALSLAQI